MNLVRPRNRCFLFLVTLAGFVLVGIVPQSSGQTDTFTAGSGNWSQTSNWSLNALPMSSNDCAFLASGVITDDAAGICKSVTLASGDILTIATPSTPTSYLYVYGTSLTNPGTITLTQSSGLHIAGNAGNVVTLSGGGSLVLTRSSTGISWGGTGEVRLVNADNTIQGQGYIGSGTMDLTNQKTIISTGGLLDIQPAQGGLTNTGLMESASGSTLQFDAGFQSIPFNNTGGTVKALSGSTLNLNSGTWNGGTFTTVGTGLMSLCTPVMNGVTNKGTMTVPSSGTPTFEGVTTNPGVIRLQSGIIYISGNATLTGSGSLLMTGGSGSSLKSLNSTDTFTNQQLIHGAGEIYALSITNQGTIQADNTSTPLSLTDQFAGGTPTTNKGTLQASGGGMLQIENTVNNTGGIIEAQNGSTVLLANGVVNGGTLTTAGTGTIQSQNGTLDGRVNTPTNTGTFIVPTPYSLSLEGTVANNGTITVDGSSCLDLLQPTTLTGSGQLTMDSGSCVTGSGQTFTIQSTIAGAGNIGDSNPMPIVNNGTIIANSTSPLTITPNVTGFTNNGTLSVSTGSMLTINGTFKNFARKTLSGGIYSLSGTLEFPNAAIATNSGNLILAGTGAHILDSTTLKNALASLNLNNSNGTLSLQSGAALTTTTAFTNKGKTTVGAGSTFKVGSSYTQSGSTTTVDGTLTASTGLTVKGGSLVGQGTISAAVTVSGGSVTVGNSTTKPGVLTVTGSYTQSTTTANLNVVIGGTTVGTQYSQLAVSNGIALDGVLTIKLTNHFVPTIGSTFTILKGTAVSGTFTTVKGTSINSGEHFQVNYQSNDVTLSVVAGP
jgi:hypothetical protein